MVKPGLDPSFLLLEKQYEQHVLHSIYWGKNSKIIRQRNIGRNISEAAMFP
jgi:hypothetical protein